MKIVQLTDIHVGLEGELLHGVDVRSNFIKVMDAISTEKATWIVLTGDLCATTPDAAIYKWLHEVIAGYHLEDHFLYISGNHDNNRLLGDRFGMTNLFKDDEIYYSKSNDYGDFIFLDTSADRSSLKQKEWLVNELDKTTKNVYIFMHHPPYPSGVFYMDSNHALKDMEDFQEIFEQFRDRLIYVFSGHYHVEKFVNVGNVRLFITPSCYVQIDQEARVFKPDHYNIGYRVIEINQKGHLKTTVRYLPG